MPGPADMLGTWSLVSWQTRDANGTIGHPFGADASGLLIYDRGGYMSGAMMRTHRRAFARPRTQAVQFEAGDPEELAEAFNSFLSYAGRWEIGADGLVRHHVEIASIPGWAGTTLLREAHVDAGELILRTPPRIVAGLEQRGVLRWRAADDPAGERRTTTCG
jgi:lipocalin-like protein